MKQFLLYKFCLIILLSSSCNRKPNSEFTKGTWILKNVYHNYSSYVQIQDDSISIPNFHAIFTKISAPFELTSDSLNIANPCVKERHSYTIKNDTFFIDSMYIMYRPSKISAETYPISAEIDITLEEKNKKSISKKIGYDYHTIKIGRRLKNTEFFYPKYFSNKYALAINGNLCDSVKIKDWFKTIKGKAEEKINIVIYKDKSFSEVTYYYFLRKIDSISGNKAIFHEVYFNKNSEYFLGIKETSFPTLSSKLN
jgi:hypothetical protein